MNADQLIRMLMRLAGNRMFRQALSRGIDRMARGAGDTTDAGTNPPESPQSRARQQQANALGKRVRDIARITRRMR